MYNIGRTDQRLKLTVVICCFITTLSIAYAITQQIFFTKNNLRTVRNVGYDERVLGMPLPDIQLVDLSGKSLQDDEVRKGRVFLAILSPSCDACLVEGKFLKTVIERYGNFRFYGVFIFWRSEDLNEAESKFPANLKLLLDKDYALVKTFGIRSVPLKIYLENGIIKRIWQGAEDTPQNEARFLNDLDNIAKRQSRENK